MAAESDRYDDILRLNALVDGELSAAERATMASRLAADRDLARAHATLASLKACIVASAETASVPLVPELAPRPWLPRMGWAAAAAAVVGLVVFLGAIEFASERDTPSEFPHTIVQLAALPASPVVPDLAVAGLKLTGVAMETPGGIATLIATYQGPRGCRLVLRAQRADNAIPTAGGTSRRTWTVDDLAYELTAYGMPGERFVAIAAAAEHATRRAVTPADSRRLRQASTASRPCIG